MKDLSDLPLAKTSLVAGSSMAAGNTVNTHAREDGMAAPGSEPVDPMSALETVDDPNITVSVNQPVPSTLASKKGSTTFTATPQAWKKAGA